MSIVNKSITVALTAADADVLAASGTGVVRYIRSVHAENTDTVQRVWSYGVGANLTAGANADAYQEPLAAKTRAYPIHYGGKGKLVPAATAIRGFADSAAVVNLTIVYDEVTTP